MKNSILQNQEPVKGSLELKFYLFDYKYCAIILLMREIIIFYDTNNSTRGLFNWTELFSWTEDKVVFRKFL